jgi:2-keto-4-pentenoate hydratase
MTAFDAGDAARRLLQARKGAALLRCRELQPPDALSAYAVQDATLAQLGTPAGWKVIACGPALEPVCAPLPQAGIHGSGTALLGPPWSLRGIELHVGLRLGRDLVPGGKPFTVAQLQSAVDALLPAIEVVETRLADWRDSDPLAQLADLHNHGALVLGAPASVDPATLDLRTVEAYLAFDGQPVAHTYGANAAGDAWRLLGWLAQHAAARGHPLRAGQVIATGSCTGLLFAPEGARVQGHVKGIGLVELGF